MFYSSRRVPSVPLLVTLAWPLTAGASLAPESTPSAVPPSNEENSPDSAAPKSPSTGASAEVAAELPSVGESPAPAEDSATVSTTSTTAASPEVDAVSPSERYSPREPKVDRKRWIHRYPPQAMTGEVGIYGGVWFPSRLLELYGPDPSLPNSGFQRLKPVAADLGVRGGFYPLRFLGVEVEAGLMPARTRQTEERATAWAVRGHVIAQLGLWSITPFILAGVGVLGVSGDAPPASLGKDQDVAIHFGGGAKFQINEWVQLRLDVRDVVSNQRGVGQGLTSSPEILLGLSVTLGRRKERTTQDGGLAPKPDDRDGDGIDDKEDYCPDVYGEPPRGCPQVCVDDSDADGLTDPVDQCPTQPESRNGFEDMDGCPDEVPPELETLAGVMEGIQFDTDKDTIKDGSRPTLDHAVEVMKKYPELRVEVGGHTDSRGAYRHNMDLSQRRAESVKAYLVAGGIDASRVETRGYGPDQPLQTNDTAEGRAANRRIEFKILNEDPQAPVQAGPSL